jgi:hypothetical protein
MRSDKKMKKKPRERKKSKDKLNVDCIHKRQIENRNEKENR